MLFSASALLSTLLIVASSPLTLAVPTRVEESRDLRPRTSPSSCNFQCQPVDTYKPKGSQNGNSGTYQCIYEKASSDSITCTYGSNLALISNNPSCPLTAGTCPITKRSFTEAQSELAEKIQKRQWKRAKAKKGVAQKRR